ncbi:NAD(P)/FAD-dependent oxidoreductase [Aliihoeflea sp. PC F10.4]
MINRRTFLASGAFAGLSTAAMAQPNIVTGETMLRQKGSAPRIVIAGGGWGGLTAARYLREKVPDAEVIVLERNPVFWSCPISNKWLIDIVDTDYLLHDMLKPAEKYGYDLIQTEVTAIERNAKRVRTSNGSIDYDYLILAGGIRNAYEAWYGNDHKAIAHTRQAFPSAYVPNAEHIALKQKIHNFEGGTMVMTLPPPPHRCPPSPYERACVMAWHFKTNNIPAKILILDPKPRVMPINGGFTAAFEELYPDIITHVPNAGVKEVDPFNKTISTEAGDFEFDDAVLMPPHQAADMVWYADLIAKNGEGKPTGWADIHPTMLHARDDEDVYVIGDAMGAISQQFGHYPKSGHVANYMGRIVATYIAQRIADEEVKTLLPDNLCYMLVNGDPREAISVEFEYELLDDGTVHQTQIDIDIRGTDLLEEDFKWAQGMYADFLARPA